MLEQTNFVNHQNGHLKLELARRTQEFVNQFLLSPHSCQSERGFSAQFIAGLEWELVLCQSKSSNVGLGYLL